MRRNHWGTLAVFVGLMFMGCAAPESPVTTTTPLLTTTTLPGTTTTIAGTKLAASSISFADGAAVYQKLGSGAYTNTVLGTGDGALSYTSGTPATATVDDKTGAVTLVAAGTTVITANRAATGTSAAATASYTLTVGTLEPSTLVFDTGTETYVNLSSKTFTPKVSGVGSGELSYSSSDPTVATVDEKTGVVKVLAAGTTVIKATKAATATHAAVTKTFSLTTGSLDASTIVFDKDAVSKVLGSGTFVNLVGGIGTGSLTYVSGTPSVATIDASTGEVTLLAAGTTVITAQKAATTKNAATTGSYVLTVTTTPVPITGGIVTEQTVIFADGNGTIYRKLASGTYTNVVSGAGEGRVTYSSSNKDVATVDALTGVVTLLKVGAVTIYVNKEATKTAKSVYTWYGLRIGTDDLLPSTIVFADGDKVTRDWSSDNYTNAVSGDGDGAVSIVGISNSLVATTAGKGALWIQGAGTTVITVAKDSTTKYASVKASYTLTVNPITPKITFAAPGLSADIADKSVAGLGYTNDNKLAQPTYTSSDPKVATVDSTGALTLVGTGKTDITLHFRSVLQYAAAKVSYPLTVTSLPASSLTFADGDKVSKPAGVSYTNVLTQTGDGAVTYTSSNISVATVASNGQISAVGAGTTTITATKAATANYRGCTASYVLTVTQISGGGTTSNLALLPASANGSWYLPDNSVQKNVLFYTIKDSIDIDSANNRTLKYNTSTGELGWTSSSSTTWTAIGASDNIKVIWNGSAIVYNGTTLIKR